MTHLARPLLLLVAAIALASGILAVKRAWYPNMWLHHDGSFYLNTARGVLERGSLRQETLHPHSWFERDMGWNRTVDAAYSNISLGPRGEWWPKHPMLMPLASIPFIWSMGPIGALVVNLLMLTLGAVFAFRIALRVAPPWAAFVVAAVYGLTPFVAEQAWGFNNDVFYSVFLLAAVDMALGGRAALAGALLGISFFAKFTNVLYVPAFMLLFSARTRWRELFRFCAAAGVLGLLYLGMNWVLFGSPFSTSYDRILVRLNGVVTMYSHSVDFHWRELGPSLRRALFGPEGFWGRAPYAFAAIPGFIVLAWRREWRVALALAWMIIVPIVFHAPYIWYRLPFNLPQLALCVAPIAALAGRPREVRIWTPGWRQVLVVTAVALAVVGFWRRTLGTPHGYFWNHVPWASVHLGNELCDYYNNRHERWECHGRDGLDWYMTGRALFPYLTYEGKHREMILLHPHPSKKERSITFPDVPMTRQLGLVYGLADSSHDGKHPRFVVRVEAPGEPGSGEILLDEEVTWRGLRELTLDTTKFAGRNTTLRFSVQSDDPSWTHLVFDGGPQ